MHAYFADSSPPTPSLYGHWCWLALRQKIRLSTFTCSEHSARHWRSVLFQCQHSYTAKLARKHASLHVGTQACTGLSISESTKDWSEKCKAAAASVFPGIPLRRGIEHLKRNLRSNQSQGKRGPRKSRAKAAAKSKAKAKALPRAAPRPAPHLGSRSIWAAINVIAEIMYMPSQAMVHLALECFLDWVRLQWGEQLWHDYFVREYVDRCTLEKQTFGRQELFMPHWWSGAGISRRWDEPGHPASQQAAEQQNSKFKKDIRKHAPERKLTTHQAVVSSIQGCLRTWLRPIGGCCQHTFSSNAHGPAGRCAALPSGSPRCLDAGQGACDTQAMQQQADIFSSPWRHSHENANLPKVDSL